MNNFFLYIINNKVEKVPINKTIKEKELFGYKIILHEAKKDLLHEFIFTEVTTGCTIAKGRTVAEALKDYDKKIKNIDKLKFIKAILKQLKINKENE